MENATKALLIAAAVLVAIIIISLTLGVVRQGQETISSADMSEAEMDAYNAKFIAFEGSNATVADVNALLSTVLTHNQNQAQQKSGRYVSVTGAAKLSTTATSIDRLSGSARYTIKCTLTNGLVTSINITNP